MNRKVLVDDDDDDSFSEGKKSDCQVEKKINYEIEDFVILIYEEYFVGLIKSINEEVF